MPELEGTAIRGWQIDTFLEAVKTLGNSSDIAYEIKKLQQYREGLLSMSPVRVGDRVVITEAPDIDKSSGWWSSRHFLVSGSIGTVRVVDWSTPLDEESGTKGYFVAYVMFDRESHLSDYDDDNRRIPDGSPRREVFTDPERRHVFGLGARRLKVVPAEPSCARNAREG